MPFTTPVTWVDGEVVTAADLNTEIRDNMGSVNTAATAAQTSATAAQTTANQGHRILTTTAKNALTGVTTGTMVYDSTLNRMQVWNGSAWGEPWGTNNVVYASYQGQTTTTTAYAWVAANFTATITPRSATSKVLVQPCIHAALFRGNVTGVGINFRIKRDGAVIYNATSNIGAMYVEALYNVNTSVATGGFINVQFMDTPATTSAVSYTFECQNAASGTLYVNYSGGSSTTSTAVLTEITV